MSTPWGQAQSIRPLKRGIAKVSTAGHGGYRVARALALESIPHDMLRHAIADRGYFWFEEDCAWCVVAICFAELFPQITAEYAATTFARWYGQRVAV